MLFAIRPYSNAVPPGIPGRNIEVKLTVRSVFPFDTAVGIGIFLEVSLDARLCLDAMVVRQVVMKHIRIRNRIAMDIDNAETKEFAGIEYQVKRPAIGA